MTSTLVSWVNEWFYRPGTEQTPSDDRMYCYNAAVALIGVNLGSTPARSVQRNLHDLLTYLLLGWNPITAWPKESEFERPERSEPEVMWDSVIETIKKLLDFKNRCKPSVYHLLNCLTTMCKQHGSVSAPLYVGERITMIMLALWLLNKNATYPKSDLGLIRALLDVYYRSESTPLEDVSIEYARTNHSVYYCSWFNRQIDRLIKMNIESDQFINDLAYMGWFISLVRSSRMLRSRSRNTEWTDEIVHLLAGEVDKLKTALDRAALRCSEDRVREGSRLSAARLFRAFKIKPPPVKIKPNKS